MRRFTVFLSALILAWVATAAAGQKAPTAADLDKMMKKAGAANQAISKAIAGGNQAEVKTQIAALRQAITEGQAFWTAAKKDDAVQMGKTTLTKIDVLEKAAAGSDAAPTGAAVRDLGTSCATCHRAYRINDDESGFILKPGTI